MWTWHTHSQLMYTRDSFRIPMLLGWMSAISKTGLFLSNCRSLYTRRATIVVPCFHSCTIRLFGEGASPPKNRFRGRCARLTRVALVKGEGDSRENCHSCSPCLFPVSQDGESTAHGQHCAVRRWWVCRGHDTACSSASFPSQLTCVVPCSLPGTQSYPHCLH